MRAKKLISVILWLALVLGLVGCANSTTISTSQPTATSTSAVPTNPPTTASSLPPATLNIFAAASLTSAFTEIGQAFQAEHPNITVLNNFAGSQQLAQQINLGAPADVFASANTVQMTLVITTGAVISGSQQIFANNKLVVIYPQNNPGQIKRLQDLAEPGLKLVLADKAVPVGNYTLTFLQKASQDPAFGADFQANVLKNVVSYENDVKAVLAKVQLGEADAGIVYTTDAASAEAGKIGQLAIPDTLNVIAKYPIAPVKDSPNPEIARLYIDFVLSPQGQAILVKYGFITPK